MKHIWAGQGHQGLLAHMHIREIADNKYRSYEEKGGKLIWFHDFSPWNFHKKHTFKTIHDSLLAFRSFSASMRWSSSFSLWGKAIHLHTHANIQGRRGKIFWKNTFWNKKSLKIFLTKWFKKKLEAHHWLTSPRCPFFFS